MSFRNHRRNKDSSQHTVNQTVCFSGSIGAKAGQGECPAKKVMTTVPWDVGDFLDGVNDVLKKKLPHLTNKCSPTKTIQVSSRYKKI